ncbi:hypothetical protein TYRP_001535 [Tyrophagus putrescentiae]|nr:hypothetical protein TYRP_001535 [Tyrophagus putrescentiae]
MKTPVLHAGAAAVAPRRLAAGAPSGDVPLILRRPVHPSQVILAITAVAKGLGRAAATAAVVHRPGAMVPPPLQVNGVDVVPQVAPSDRLRTEGTGQEVVGAGRLVGGGGVEAVGGGGHLCGGGGGGGGAEAGVVFRNSNRQKGQGSLEEEPAAAYSAELRKASVRAQSMDEGEDEVEVEVEAAAGVDIAADAEVEAAAAVAWADDDDDDDDDHRVVLVHFEYVVLRIKPPLVGEAASRPAAPVEQRSSKVDDVQVVDQGHLLVVSVAERTVQAIIALGGRLEGRRGEKALRNGKLSRLRSS